MLVAEEKKQSQEIWGILGGMGPLASAEFIKTIYEQNKGLVEQAAPIVLLLSDPSIPDRTECLLNGKRDILLSRLSSGMSQLISAGATRIIVCCVTIHSLMPFLPVTLRERVVSLVDLVFDALLRGGRKSLLLCTRGTMLTGVFDHHQAWKYARDLLVLPSHEDQETVHELIYEIKMNGPDARHLSTLDFMMRKYQVSSYTAACTELHILTRERARVTGCNSNDFSIDPLVIAASMMSQSVSEVYAGSGE